MNSRLGIFGSTVLILAGIALWSVTVLAEPLTADAAIRESAQHAHHEAAADAAERIKASSKLELDIELIGRTSTKTAGN